MHSVDDSLRFYGHIPKRFSFQKGRSKDYSTRDKTRASEVATVRLVFRLICQNQFELRRRKASLWGSKTVSDLQFLAKNTRKRGCILGQAYSVTSP